MEIKVVELLQKQYWIIDILPERVPADSPGQYFEIEEYFLEKRRLDIIKQKHINVILKMNCYYKISIGDTVNPAPEQIAEEVMNRSLNIIVGDTMIVSNPDDTYLTVYNPDEEMLSLIGKLANAEGLFLWRG